MDRAFLVAKNSWIFNGVELEEFNSVVTCLGARKRKFKKKQNIFKVEDEIKEIGIVLKGEIKISKEDINGNLDIISKLGPSDIFGEAFACAGVKNSPVDIDALTDTEILFLTTVR